MQHTSIVPHDHVVLCPGVLERELRLGDPRNVIASSGRVVHQRRFQFPESLTEGHLLFVIKRLSGRTRTEWSRNAVRSASNAAPSKLFRRIPVTRAPKTGWMGSISMGFS